MNALGARAGGKGVSATWPSPTSFHAKLELEDVHKVLKVLCYESRAGSASS